MFTGLIEEVGTVRSIPVKNGGTQLQIHSPRAGQRVRIGDSVAVNGCCLTVTDRQKDELTFDLLEQTLDRTNLGTLRRNGRVNLECALAVGAPLGGHFVQGHIDCATRILALEENGPARRLEIELPPEFSHYVANKGSIAVNGVSLTVAEMLPESFAVWIIPHTRAQTNLGTVRAGEFVNLEFDLLAKYLERMLDRKAVRSE